VELRESLSNLLSELSFIFQRVNWLSIIDILLVTIIFYIILIMVKDTQAIVLLRGVIFLLIFMSALASLGNLPAFSWLLSSTLPALLFAIPVIFAPEIRRALERLGRAGTSNIFMNHSGVGGEAYDEVISAIVVASKRLSIRKHGALIVVQRNDSLNDYIKTGVLLDARVAPELLIQIFYPNTPLHDGAVIISGNILRAASCVMPLSASGILTRSPERQMGLRHRAALGTSEATDAITIVVSEETGSISIAHGGRIIRRLDSERLENILKAFFRPADEPKSIKRVSRQALRWLNSWFHTEQDA
jgi:diadenylate cyclase